MIELDPNARYVALAHGRLDVHDAKTAVALFRYRPESVVAVIDREHAGGTVEEVLGFGGAIPIVATLEEALELEPSHLLIATALAGGTLPADWRAILVAALEAGLDLVSGLHTPLESYEEIAAAAERHGRRLVELREVPTELGMPDRSRTRVECPVVLTVGSDCNVGKMTAVWELCRAAESQELRTTFVPTGQTGVLLAGWGMAIDRVISDFVAGASEQLVVEAWQRDRPDLVLVEGQGSLIHPFFSGVTLGLLHGTAPDAMILCHVVGRETVRHRPDVAIPDLERLVEIYEEAAGWICPAPVIGVSLATFRVDETAAREAVEEARNRTGLPCEDPVRFPTGELLSACRSLSRSDREHPPHGE